MNPTLMNNSPDGRPYTEAQCGSRPDPQLRSQAGPQSSPGPTRRPMWWWLFAAFLAFAVIVTGAFVWQRTTRVTAQKIYDELVSLDPNVTEDQLTARGYVYGGQAAYGWHGVDGEEFPQYAMQTGDDRIDRFMNDVRAGRESVLRLVVRGVGQFREGDSGAVGGVSVRVLWFDPSAVADWAEKDDVGQPATIHHDGKGQIREWWWRDGAVVTSDKRFARGIQKDDSSGYVLKHQPAIPSDPDSPDTIIRQYDESLYVIDTSSY